MLGTVLSYLCLFAVESYGIVKVYDVAYQYLDQHWPAFAKIHPAHKKWYVLSNYIKSVSLAAFAPFCTMVLYDNVFHNDWNNTLVLHLGCLYAVLDFTSIIKVPKLAKNTLYHHVAVTILYFYTLTNGMHVDSFSRLIVVYAVFSTLAFPVNAYLATRVITDNQLLLKTFSSVAFVNYVTCCALNWSYQVFHLAWRDHFLTEYGLIPIILFAGFIAVVMSDDIILIRYLRDHSFFDWLKPDIPAAVTKTVLVIRNSIPDTSKIRCFSESETQTEPVSMNTETKTNQDEAVTPVETVDGTVGETTPRATTPQISPTLESNVETKEQLEVASEPTNQTGEVSSVTEPRINLVSDTVQTSPTTPGLPAEEKPDVSEVPQAIQELTDSSLETNLTQIPLIGAESKDLPDALPNITDNLQDCLPIVPTISETVSLTHPDEQGKPLEVPVSLIETSVSDKQSLGGPSSPLRVSHSEESAFDSPTRLKQD